jgi:hypothetical protein
MKNGIYHHGIIIYLLCSMQNQLLQSSNMLHAYVERELISKFIRYINLCGWRATRGHSFEKHDIKKSLMNNVTFFNKWHLNTIHSFVAPHQWPGIMFT